MKRILVSGILLLVLTVYIFPSSSVYWHTAGQNPDQVYDIQSIPAFPSTKINDSGLSQTIIFDYIGNDLDVFGCLEGEQGRIGFIIDKNSDQMLIDYIEDITGKQINPVEFGILGAKKMDAVNLGMLISGMYINEYNHDDLTIYNNSDTDISRVNIQPSVSLLLPGDVIFEISPVLTVGSALYEDNIVSRQSTTNIAYSINSRIVQNLSGNIFQLSVLYNSKPLSYSQTVNENTDEYENKKDSLNIGISSRIETFNYINTYFSFNYIKSDLYNNIVYSSGSQSESKTTSIVLPEVSLGFNVYINRHIELIFGTKGQWIDTVNELAPQMNPDVSTSSFNTEYRFGVRIVYNNFKCDIGLNKRHIALPFFIGGNTLTDNTFNVGVSYNGFEY